MAQNVVRLDVCVLMEDVDGIVVEEMELGRQVLRAKATQGWDCADKWTCEAHLVTKEQRLDCERAVKCITAKIRRVKPGYMRDRGRRGLRGPLMAERGGCA
jgi:hypothetical protein